MALVEVEDEDVFAPNARRGGWRVSHSPGPAGGRKPLDTKKILHDWHTHRRLNMGLETIDDGHSCGLSCALSGALVAISHEHNLYGCVNSGIHHVCSLDEGCELLKTTMDGGVWCLFSNRFVETFVDQTRFGKAMEAKELNSTTDLPKQPHDAPSERLRRKKKREEIREERLKAARVEQTTAVGHTEDPSFSRPDRVRFGLRVKESEKDIGVVPQDEPVVMHPVMGTGKRTRADGDDDDDDDDDDADETPLLICDSRSTSARNSKSGTLVTETKRKRARLRGGAGGWRGKEKLRQAVLPVAQIRQPRALVETERSLFLHSVPPKEFYHDHTESDIRKIVEALFDVPLRQEIHREQAEARQKVAAAAIQQYRAACYAEGARPCVHQSDALVRMTAENIPQVSVVRVEGADVQEFAQFVCTMWRLILATPYFESKPNTFRLLNHTLGCLYMMQLPLILAASDGSGYNETVTDHGNKFLAEHLPPPQLLYNWNPHIVLHSAPRIIAVKGNPGHRIAYNMSLISTGRNTIKTALLSLETQEERVVAKNMLKKALPVNLQ
jgi:hypothetical protein